MFSFGLARVPASKISSVFLETILKPAGAAREDGTRPREWWRARLSRLSVPPRRNSLFKHDGSQRTSDAQPFLQRRDAAKGLRVNLTRRRHPEHRYIFCPTVDAHKLMCVSRRS